MKQKLLYWIPHTLLLLLMVGSAIMYFVQSDFIAQVFVQLGYPAYSMYINATAKILGGIAMISPVPKFLKEFAYAGYLYILILAFFAVIMTPMPNPDGTVSANMALINTVMFTIFLIIWGLAYWQFKTCKCTKE